MSLKTPNVGETLATTYNEAFFAQHREYSIVYQHLASLIRAFSPAAASRVADVGCGHCLLLSSLQAHFSSVHGIDGSDAGVPEHCRPLVTVTNLESSDWSKRAPLTAEVVVSFETAEHLHPNVATSFIAQLTAHRPQIVFFTAATQYQDQGGNPTHYHEQSLGYWVTLFEGYGYALSIDKAVQIREAMQATTLYYKLPWYMKNMLIFEPGIVHTEQSRFPSRLHSSDPVTQLIFDRDRLEFENLVLRRRLNALHAQGATRT